MDKIVMNGMEFYGYHGMTEQEQKTGQVFLIDAELYLDLKRAGMLDSPEHTVDYASVAQVIKSVVEGPPCKLLEAVAEKISIAILGIFPVKEVMVRVKKPQAPLPVKFEHMAVEIRRNK